MTKTKISKKLFLKKTDKDIERIRKIMDLNLREAAKDIRNDVWIISDSSSDFPTKNLIDNG